MVKRTFASACHRLPTIPYLVREGVDLGPSEKRIESREPEGTQDSDENLAPHFVTAALLHERAGRDDSHPLCSAAPEQSGVEERDDASLVFARVGVDAACV